MCGIAGKLHLTGAPVDRDLLRRMADTIRHRGPDDGGVWTEGSVGFASRRLAIQDLSPNGHMPMSTADGRLHITFNGEIYNFLELRSELERGGARFRSGTDTEVILHLYAKEGVSSIRRLRGMFAFGLWDSQERTLVLARDRLGKKPLFFSADDRQLVFGSEPKALLQDPLVRADVEHVAIHHYLSYGYVPSPWCAFKGIRKLPPAHVLIMRDAHLTLERYWSLHYQPKRQESERALRDELQALLEDATRLRLISDVPVGALLSGGVDSSAVVALARRVSSGRIRTFAIGFDQPDYDESEHARRVAIHLGTDHQTLIVKPDAVAMLPQLVWHYNEPFADSSAIPTFAVTALARQSVTVALTGDGGDESFIGYERYLAARAGVALDHVPLSLRRMAATAGTYLPVGKPKSHMARLRRLLTSLDMAPRERYASWMLYFDDSMKQQLYTADFREMVGGSSFSVLDAAYSQSDAIDFIESTVHSDVQTYLPDDLLVKIDIASMAHSLEVRSPLLDHHVVEFAARLPIGMKLRGLTQKYLLKSIADPWLPRGLFDRPKMGFAVPLDNWFRHELREMAYDLLLSRRAANRGYFNQAVVRRYLDDHVAGRAHHHHRLWNLLILESWHRMWLDESAPSEAPAHWGQTGDTQARPLSGSAV